MDEKWGAGSKTDAKPFGKAVVGENGRVDVDLIFGEFPHSRRDNNIYARYSNGQIEAFDGHRVQVGVELHTFNYLKESELSGNEIREGGQCRIFFNKRQVYEFFFRDPFNALLRAHELLYQLFALPIDLWEEDVEKKIVGRKVYYREMPAVVESIIFQQGCVILRAQTPSGYFTRPVWAEVDEERHQTVKIEVVSPHIWWWRK